MGDVDLALGNGPEFAFDATPGDTAGAAGADELVELALEEDVGEAAERRVRSRWCRWHMCTVFAIVQMLNSNTPMCTQSSVRPANMSLMDNVADIRSSMERMAEIGQQVSREMEPIREQARQVNETISRATRGLQAWYGLDLRELAAASDIPYHTLRRRLIGDARSEWRADEVLRVALVFDIPLADLYGGEVNTRDGVVERITELLRARQDAAANDGSADTCGYQRKFLAAA